MSGPSRTSTIPSGWALSPIGDLLAPFENANPGKSDRDTFWYVDIEAIDNQEHRITAPKSLPTDRAPSRARKVIRKGDVLISLVRPYLKNIAIVPVELNEQWASTAFCVCRPRNGVDSRFLYYLYLQNEFLNAIPTYGDSPPSGHDDDLLATVIALPPESEQSRIADRIDELFTDLAAGVAALERVKRNLSRYRAAVLHAAVTGRLTEAWRKEHGPPDEPASKLLERILVERRKQWERRTLAAYEAKGKQPPKNWKSRYKEPALPKLPEDGTTLPELPEGWCWASNDQLVGIITSGSRDWSPYYGSGTGTFIMAQNVRMGHLDRSYRQAVNPPPDHRDRKRSQVEEHDLLVTIVGANTGDVCRVPERFPEHYVCQSVALMRPVLGDSSPWLEVWFTAPTGAQRQFKEFIYGAGRPHLGFEHLEQTLVALPPLDEQSAVIEAATEKLSQIDALEAEVARGLARAGRLRQAILKAAFEGRLVPQDPSDEPASVLLERIRQQSADAPKPRRKTRKKKAANV